MERYTPNLTFLRVRGFLAKVLVLELKWENIGPKTFDPIFVRYVRNNATYRFISLNDFFICESRDVEFFKHFFPLKKNNSTAMHEIIPMHYNVSISCLNLMLRDSVNKRGSSNIRRAGTSLGHDFLTTLLIEDLVVNFLTDEPNSSFFIKKHQKTYSEAMRSIDPSF